MISRDTSYAQSSFGPTGTSISMERFNQILAHQITAIIGAAETLERAAFKTRAKLREDRLTQLAPRRIATETAVTMTPAVAIAIMTRVMRIQGRLITYFA